MINIQSIDDNEYFKWCLVRYLNPADYHAARITKADKDIAKKLDLENIKFPVKLREIHKTERKNSIDISVFSYVNKEKYRIYVSKKCCKEKPVDLLLIGEGEKKHYVVINDFNRSMYGMIIHYITEGNIFVGRYILHAFITEKMLKRHIKDFFKTNGKQTVIMPKKGEYVKFKHFERKMRSPFMIYADFKSTLVPEGNGRKIQMSLILINIKNMLLVVMVIN